jgi:uncharacterized protein (TIGR03067 family)
MSEAHPLHGVWQPIHAELDGTEAPLLMLEKTEVELADGRYTVRFDGVAADHGTFTVEVDRITLCGVTGPNAGRTIPAIFKFAGEVLSICYGLSGERPRKFSTAGGRQLYLANYQRKK